MIPCRCADHQSLSIGDAPPILLDAQNGNPTEIHSLGSSLSPLGVASTRLTVPITSVSSARAADKLRAQNEALDKERKERAERVNGTKTANRVHAVAAGATTMSRTQSSPAGTGGSSTAGQVPLKTRVVQLLALGPMEEAEIVRRVGGVEQDVMRVVKVVGRQSLPGCYSLQPSQYSKVKISNWKYTFGEQQEVIRLAREAFEELGLPPNAEERLDLDRKEQEALAGGSATSSTEEQISPPQPETAAVPSPPPIPKQPSKSKPSSTKGKSAIAKEMAKFRAEAKRAASLPNVKGTDGTASPRLNDHGTASPRAANGDGRIPSSPVESLADRLKERQAKIRREAREQKAESGESSEEERGRRRELKPARAPTPAPKVPEPKNGKRAREEQEQVKPDRTRAKVSRDYSSSDEEPASKARRKSPPPSLILKPEPPRQDPDALRDRYEELFPAYQLLTQRLAGLHRAAEGVQVGDAEAEVVPSSEVTKMIAKWEKWHAELAGIRRWFSEA